MTRPDPTVSGLTGLWTRSLLQWPDGRRDTTTRVHWLQGPRLYVDLRQPAARPAFDATATFATLSAEQIAWLVRQEGFAGQLGLADGWFEWRRDIDWQPPSGQADSGRLWWEGDRLVEEGRATPYIEHWHPDDTAPPAPAAAAARLVNVDDGRHGVLVRVGSRFMLARDRVNPLPAGTDLAACVAVAGSPADAAALLDCEISGGTIDPAGWRIAHSSLPWRESTVLRLQRRRDFIEFDETLVASFSRWRVLELEGNDALLGA